jgi:ribosomal protein S18 acetylase RimI-like enzyme
MTSTSFIATTALEKRALQSVDHLLFQTYHLHTHMDWYDPLDWLQRYPVPVRLAWQGKRLAGLLAASLPLNGTCWLRIAALSDFAPAQAVIDALWQAILPDLRAAGAQSVSILITRNWIQHYIRALNFRFIENVVTLERSGTHLPALPEHPFVLRPLRPEDLPRVAQLDQAAFDPPWQMSFDEIREAQRVAALSTVAEHEQIIVGYQVSTVYGESAHLARLAVDPAQQNRGVGTALLHDALRRFFRRQIHEMTVNTQAHNTTSQRLYRHFDFRRNGYDPSVWTFDL